MLRKIILSAITAAFIVMVLPSQVDAYGAVHRGYTHVGPNGVYHTGVTAGVGPYGAGVSRNTTAVGYGGGAYHSSYGAVARPAGGAAYGDYRYTPSYGGGAAYGGYRYGYVR